jgi:hypothetical protein
MNSKHIALIACSNGLGHVRRMLTLSIALRRLGARPVLYAPVSKIERLTSLMGVTKPEMIDFQFDACHDGMLSVDRDSLTHQLSELQSYEIVVSDNVVEVLYLREDAWLSGTFLWHRALDNFPKERFTQAETILRTVQPRMISSRMFAAPYLDENVQVIPVGLYGFEGIRRSRHCEDVLIACGTGGAITIETQEFVTSIAAGPRQIHGIVFVEPSLYRHDMPAWIKPADFTPSMYSRIKCAVIRPGIGTVTDLLSAGARVFSFYEQGNNEMSLNALRLAASGVGEDCRDIVRAWNDMTTWIASESNWHNHEKEIMALDLAGASQAAEQLLS